RESRVLRMEPGAELEQRADAPVHGDAAACRLDPAPNDLEQRRLARPVLADDAERFAAAHRERHAVERTKDMRRTAPAKQVVDEADAPAARLDPRVILADIRKRKQLAQARILKRNPRNGATASGTPTARRKTAGRRRRAPPRRSPATQRVLRAGRRAAGRRPS